MGISLREGCRTKLEARIGFELGPTIHYFKRRRPMNHNFRQLNIVLAIGLLVASCGGTAEIDSNCQEWLKINEPLLKDFSFGLIIEPAEVEITLRLGEMKDVMAITSVSSQGFQFCGYPRPVGEDSGVYWATWSGGLTPGRETSVRIMVYEDAKVGTYKGKVMLIDLSSAKTLIVPVEITVVP